MIPFTQRRAATVACIALAIAAIAACKSKADVAASTSSPAQQLASATSGGSSPTSSVQDPCTFLSAGEAAAYVGPLATPPYRAAGTHASVHGDECVYHGRDGRELRINPSAEGGAAAGNVLESVPNELGAALQKGGATGLDTMSHRVIAQGPAGPWDKANWIPGGSLFVTKGDAMISVDVSGASGKESDAVEVAKLVVPRLGHPLHYDGAKAVSLVPETPTSPDDICAFVSRAEVEAAIGKLASAPAPNADGSTCTYRVETSHGTREYPVEYIWEGGAQNYNMLKHSSSMLGGMIGTPPTSALDTMKPTGQMGEMLGGLMKMANGASMTTAPGASATVGLRTDTTLAGPWDQAMLYHGTQLMALRHDVMIDISLKTADYEHAKALLTAISNKLK